jgi:hypothetical protein
LELRSNLVVAAIASIKVSFSSIPCSPRVL